MQDIKVSVIIPVYNVEEYLNECMDSVVNQTLREIEIICVDDGSTDRSGEILEEYVKNDKRVKVYHQQNKYAGCARNLGLEYAQGKYVVFWDSDDFFELNALEKMYDKCEKDQAELCICGGNRMDHATGVKYRSGVYVVEKMLPEERPFSRKEIPQYIFNFTTNVPWNKMFLRKFIKRHQLQFQPLRQANDVYFSMLALYLSERITILNEPLVTYRMNNTESLTGKASDTRYCTKEAFEAVWAKLQEFGQMDDALKQSFVNRVFGALVYSLRTQWNVDSYQELYYLYRDQVFEELGVHGHEMEYFYDSKLAVVYQRMMENNAQEFLLMDFREFQQRSKNRGGTLAKVKEQNKKLKGDLKTVKKQIKEEKEKNKNLRTELERLKKIENSNSYRLGCGVTYVPRQIKKMLKQVKK